MRGWRSIVENAAHFQHIQYEYDMVKDLLEFYHSEEFKRLSDLLQNCVTESLLIHVRNLAEFHGVKSGPRSDNIKKKNIFPDESKHDDENLIDLITCINQGVAHLSVNRNKIKTHGYILDSIPRLLDHHRLWHKQAAPDTPSVRLPSPVVGVAGSTQAMTDVVVTRLGATSGGEASES
jgi:hypothetical protein